MDARGAGDRRRQWSSPCIALIVALAGTAYAAQSINGGSIKKQTIGGGKLKHKTLTGFQINTNKLGVSAVRKASRPHLLGGGQQPGRRGQCGTLHAPATPGITATEGGGAVAVVFPVNVSGCANVAGRNNAGTTVPGAGYAQTNIVAGQPERDRSPHPRRKRRRRGRRLPPDRRLSVTSREPRLGPMPPAGPSRRRASG